MGDIKEYSWWGFDENCPPKHLKTKKQLSVMGLKPGEPVGVIRTPDYDCYLYDPNTCPAKRPLSEKQRAALMRRKLLKEQAALEKKRAIAWRELELYLNSIPRYIQHVESLWVETKDPGVDLEWNKRCIKRWCDRIITNCRHAKEELKFLYPEPLPPVDADGQCRLAVLGGGQVPLDPDGQCRAAVLGGAKRPC